MKSFVPFATCALLALALAGCTPSSNSNNTATDNTTAQAPNEATENTAVISTNETPTATEQATLLSNVWVPGEGDKLHSKPVDKEALDAQKKYGNPTAALDYIIKAAPKYFPPDTQVLDFRDDGKSVSVNLNKNFEDSKFWSKAGSTTTLLAVYALVNTASQASGSNKPVVLKTEKRPVTTLGEFDASDAIEPDAKLQAGAESSAGKSASESE